MWPAHPWARTILSCGGKSSQATPGFGESSAHFTHKRDCLRIIAVDAKGAHLTLVDEPFRLPHRFLRILHESVRLGARYQTDVRQIAAVGETLGDEANLPGAGGFEPRARQPHYRELKQSSRFDHRHGMTILAAGHVVKGPMRLQVAYRPARCPRQSG